MAVVERTHHAVGHRDGLTTLEQRFTFSGDGATAADLARVLSDAPLVGEHSVFGERPGDEGTGPAASRTLGGFSPAPGFRFDVELRRADDDLFVVTFAQPDRDVPYLRGSFVWRVADDEAGAVLDEQINTHAARAAAGDPLTGPRPSLRRWLFFRVGHRRVMAGATKTVAALLGP